MALPRAKPVEQLYDEVAGYELVRVHPQAQNNTWRRFAEVKQLESTNSWGQSRLPHVIDQYSMFMLKP